MLKKGHPSSGILAKWNSNSSEWRETQKSLKRDPLHTSLWVLFYFKENITTEAMCAGMIKESFHGFGMIEVYKSGFPSTRKRI